MALTEYRCSTCGKLSGDNETGSYNEEHDVKDAKGRIIGTEKCNANGTPIVTPDAEDSN